MDMKSLFDGSDAVVDFRAGSTVFEEGKTGAIMYVVLEGAVDIRAAGEVVEAVAAGGVIGEMALLDDKKRSATAVAKTDCRLASVDERRFLALVREHPFFALHVMRALAERLRRMNERLRRRSDRSSGG